jgi:hypothetical protein
MVNKSDEQPVPISNIPRLFRKRRRGKVELVISKIIALSRAISKHFNALSPPDFFDWPGILFL